MRPILKALKEAGYELESIEHVVNVTLTVSKDGLKHRFATSPDLSAASIAEMLSHLNDSHERKLLASR